MVGWEIGGREDGRSHVLVCVCMGMPVGGIDVRQSFLPTDTSWPSIPPFLVFLTPPCTHAPPCPLQVLVAAVNPRLPMHIQCPRCGQAVTTIVRSQVNGCTFLGCVVSNFWFISSSDPY